MCLFGGMGSAPAEGGQCPRGTHRPPDHLSPGEEIALDGAALRLPHGLRAHGGSGHAQGCQHSPRAAPSPSTRLSRGTLAAGDPGLRECPEPQAVLITSHPDGMFWVTKLIPPGQKGRREVLGKNCRILGVKEHSGGMLGIAHVAHGLPSPCNDPWR